jgi:adenylate cyclase
MESFGDNNNKMNADTLVKSSPENLVGQQSDEDKLRKELLEAVLDGVEQHYGFMAGKEKGRAVLAAKLADVLDPKLSMLAQSTGSLLDVEDQFTDAEHKQVTILLSDIRGFTAITEMYTAKIVMDLLNRYFACMTQIILRYGGKIDKFMGDSIMVLFGAPSTEKDDVERAIACAVEMQRAMTQFNEQNMLMGLPELFVGIGINSGEVMAGDLGSLAHKEYTVIGDQVNLVSRIEAQSLRGQILLSENTYRLAMEFAEVSEPNRVQVKGKRDAVTLYELISTCKPYPMIVPRREERKSPRVEVKIPVFFQVLEGKNVLPEIHRGDVVDLSYNGMLAVIPFPLPTHTEIRISLSLHLLGDESTEMYARILTLQDHRDGYRASLEFTFVDELGQRAIKQFVDSIVFQA